MPERGRWPPAQALRRLDYTTLVPGATATGGGEDGGEAESRIGTEGRGPRIVGNRERGEKIKDLGGDLFSHAVTHAVSSALGRFTSVFEKGTGGATPLKPPKSLSLFIVATPGRGVNRCLPRWPRPPFPSVLPFISEGETAHHAGRGGETTSRYPRCDKRLPQPVDLSLVHQIEHIVGVSADESHGNFLYARLQHLVQHYCAAKPC